MKTTNVYENMVMVWLAALAMALISGCGRILPGTPVTKTATTQGGESQINCSYSTSFTDSAGSNPITFEYQLTTMSNGDVLMVCGIIFDYVPGTYNENYILAGTSGDPTCSVIRDLGQDGVSYGATVAFDATTRKVSYSVPSPTSPDDVGLNGTVWTIPSANCH